MANLSGKFCVSFLIFFFVTPVFTQNGRYYYDANIKDDDTVYFLDRELIGEIGQHKLQRRSPSLSTEKPVETTSSKVNSDNKTLTDAKISITKAKLGKSSSKVVTGNVTKLVETLQRNLGENGTGIRKNLTTIKPDLLNNTLVGNPLQNITLATESSEEDVSIDSFPPDEDSDTFNKTLAQHNITNSTEDTHIYYNSSIRNDKDVFQTHWLDLKNNPKALVNEVLSKSHRRAVTIKLSFAFPFYGHLVKNVTIATGGFVYTGDYVHSWLAVTQYVAPLMANFDTSLSNDSYIRYYDNGTAFTVQWERVVLQDNAKEGEFTFQTTLHQNGDIVFAYKTIPLSIKNITDDYHPVKVGISDAYIIDRMIVLVQRKTIYEYHRIHFVKEDIRNGTVIYLTALPTCLQNENCVSCVSAVIPTFQCSWCPNIKRCSSGIDRYRQDWLTYSCQTKQINVSTCTHITASDIFDDRNITYLHDSSEFQRRLEDYSNTPNRYGKEQPVKMGVSSVVAILFLIATISGLVIWVFYAYRNPHTTSGQILIKYRPSQWRWRRGEARYTAATIHM